MGDQNGRTSSLTVPDTAVPGNLSDPDELLNHGDVSRNSQDTVLNKYGDEILSFALDNELSILNGTTRSDSEGQLTFISSQGASVVDYGLCCAKGLNANPDFEVGESTLSDHMPTFLILPRPSLPSAQNHQSRAQDASSRWDRQENEGAGSVKLRKLAIPKSKKRQQEMIEKASKLLPFFYSGSDVHCRRDRELYLRFNSRNNLLSELSTLDGDDQANQPVRQPAIEKVYEEKPNAERRLVHGKMLVLEKENETRPPII